MFDLSSLQGKITTAYVALVVGALVLAAIAFWDLFFLERQLREGEIVSDLNNAILEMRREEKNLFLYGDPEALKRADGYAATSLENIRGYRASLALIMRRSALSAMVDNLTAYRDKLNGWSAIAAEQQHRKLEDEIRTLGHQIYLSVEAMSQQEQKRLTQAIQESQWYLLVFLLILGLAIYLVGRELKRVVLAPLQSLESRLESIAKGRFDHLPPPSEDREFQTFTEAFNRMLRELEIRRRRMLQSEKLASLGILASGVAHELNNPLSNISSSCQLLMEELDEASPEQLDTWLKQIDSETERGRKIVRTMLDFGGQQVFHKNRIGLLDLINETLSLVDKMLREYSAELKVNVPADLALAVDKQRIQQLFINLIQNALYASGEGVQLRISATEVEKGVSLLPDGAEVAGSLNCVSDHGGRVVEILVADDGPGIPQERVAKVFDPFFTTSEPGKGSGLGLFIVQEIVREHDGCLAIASKPGKGTQVILLLPAEDTKGD
jgi:signal transduction histidine kinase